MQNWLDPAKEIKKQIRSKFVVICVFPLACLENFHSGVSRPQNLHKEVFPSKLQCVSAKTLDPCDTSGGERGRGGSLPHEWCVMAPPAHHCPAPQVLWACSQTAGVTTRSKGPSHRSAPAQGAQQPPLPSPSLHQSLFHSLLLHPVTGVWQWNYLRLLGILDLNEHGQLLRLITHELALLKTT